MRTEIITFYYGNNYGGLLQAYCMRDFLEKRFSDDISFFPYQPKQLSQADYWGQLKTKNPIRIIKTVSKYYVLKNWKTQTARFQKPSSILQESGCDISVFGSDEIWNYVNPIIGTDYVYFGSHHSGKKIAYAVSAGNASAGMEETRKKKIAEYLSLFHTIFVRDEPTAFFVKELIDDDVSIVVDPTLLHTPDIMKINYFSKSKVNLNRNYAIIYGTYFNQEQIVHIRKTANENKLSLISVGYYNKWCEYNYLNKNPIEFLELLIGADLVFTSMFHGIMLSVKYEKYFWYSSDPYRENKVNYFINYLGLQNRKLKSNNNMMKKIDYEKVNNILIPWIDKSKKLFITAYKKQNIKESI